MFAINFIASEKIIHIKNEKISYVMGILRNGHLGHFYFGKSLADDLKQSHFRIDQNRGLTNYVYEGDFNFSLSHERLEYPVYGTTDYRVPAIELTDPTGSNVNDFKYVSHKIQKDKPVIPGLPTTRAKVNESLTLEINLEDEVLGARLTLYYTIFRNLSVIARHAALTNLGDQSIKINNMQSLSLDFMDGEFNFLHLHGDWIRERHIERFPLHRGIQSIESKKGASSATHNPFVALPRPGTDEHKGEVYGCALVYSGNFKIQCEVDSDRKLRLTCGINPHRFEWILQSQETFHTPEAILTYSDQGLNGMSQNFHDLVLNHIIPERFREIEKPVLINNWEATYFDFDEEKLLDIASKSKEIGIEMFVLDDGWFSTRDSDRKGLGDWRVNMDKLPNGIKGLSHKIHELGLKFGLWIEPEMINGDVPIFSNHPQWVLGDPRRNRSHGRNQYVLDYANPLVVEHIFEQLISVIDDAKIDYIKWDMNRNITEAYSSYLSQHQQGELMHRYILGVYQLYERLTDRYPEILIESCAAGGGRFDLGLLYYAPQAWTSDNSDAVERLKIQYGTSMLYPLQTMGAHVSAIPNHQLKRETSLKMRGDVAYFGAFGYELNVSEMSDFEKNQMIDQIKFYKDHRTLIHSGDFYRLVSPFDRDQNTTAWQVVAKDQATAIVAWYQSLAVPNQGAFTLKLKGLNKDAFYEISGFDMPYQGCVLMNFGLLLKPSFNGIETSGDAMGDYQSRIWIIKKVS